MSVPKKTNRKDGVLSPEELQKAIEEYKARRTQQADDSEEKPAAETTVNAAHESAPTVPSADEEEPATDGEGEGVEEQVEAIKERNSDAGGDMKLLFDIIDTLLAGKDFDGDDNEEVSSSASAATPAVSSPDAQQDSEDDPVPTQDGDCGGETQQDSEDDPIPTASEPKMNADSIDAMIRARVQVGMMGHALNLDGLENMKLMDAKKAVIKAVRPSMNLDGRSTAYINAAYDMACSEVKALSAKDTGYQKRQMFNSATRADAKSGAGNGESAAERRQAMIERSNKKKEDK